MTTVLFLFCLSINQPILKANNPESKIDYPVKDNQDSEKNLPPDHQAGLKEDDHTEFLKKIFFKNKKGKKRQKPD